jgi:uncharacterized membrane protein YbhN (UPF0104 family)
MSGGVRSAPKTARMALCLLVSAVFLLLVFRRVDWPLLGRQLTHLRPGWWLAGLLFFGVAYLLGACRWHLMLLLKGLAISRTVTFRSTLIGHFFNTLLLGPAAGDVAKSAFYGRWHRQPVPEILAASWMDRLAAAGGSVVVALLLLGVLAVEEIEKLRGKIHFSYPAAGLLLAGLAGISAAAWLLLRFRRAGFLARTVDALVAGVARLAQNPRVALRSVALGALVQLLFSSVLALSLQAVAHEPVPWLRLFWIFPLISAITALPVSMAGLGVREGSALVMLGWFGIPAAQAVAAALLTLVINLLWAATGGLLFWWEERRLTV